MSLFSKLFKKQKGKDESAALFNREAAIFSDKLAAWHEPDDATIPFNPSQLRIVVFRESDRGRQLLFDSACLRVVSRLNGITKAADTLLANSPKLTTPSRKPSGPDASVQFATASVVQSPAPVISSTLNDQRKAVAQTIRQSRSDVKMFGEMIFGSIPITVRSVITKVHEMRNPFQLMLTKVYPVYLPVSRHGEGDENHMNGTSGVSESRSSVSSDESMSLHASPPYSQLFVPDRINRRSASAMAMPRMTPSQSSSSFSSLTFSPPPALAAYGNGSSFKRRMMRHRSTSIDNGVKMLLDMDQEEEFSDGHVRAKKSVVAVACVVWVSEKEDAQRELFHEFFFTHTPLFEYSLNLFKARLEMAMSEDRTKLRPDKPSFSDLMATAYEEFCQEVTRFITAPRLPLPMWLIVASEKISDQSYIPVLRLRLVDSLTELVLRHDVKESQFFVSRLLTAVLTGHLGWVSTVTPSNSQTSSYKMKHEPGWAQPLAKSHPYNPLWAQLGDLLGMCGTPPRLTKTILVSQNRNLLNAYLHVISYFIRTSDVLYHRFEPVATPAVRRNNDQTPTPGEPTENGRIHRHQSGDNFRAGNWFNKSKRISGPRSRLTSFDEQMISRPVLAHKISNQSAKAVLHQDRSNDDKGDTVDGMNSRQLSVDNFATLSASKSFTTLSGVTSRSSITEESVFWETSTDDNKLQTVCEVAAQVLSKQVVGKDDNGIRRRRYTMLDRQDALESREFVRNLPRPPKHTSLSINKQNEKPVTIHVQEAPVARYQAVIMHPKFADQAYENAASFGTSVIAAPQAKYTPHFALQGCESLDMEKLSQDLQVAAENSLTDEPCSDACAIVADLDHFTVKVVSRKARKCPRGVLVQPKVRSPSGSLFQRESDCHASNFVVQMLEAVASLWTLRTTPEFCLMHLEDRLQEMYVQSQTMASFIRHQSTIDTKEMMDMLGLEMSDFPLLFAVASTHSADVVADLDLS